MNPYRHRALHWILSGQQCCFCCGSIQRIRTDTFWTSGRWCKNYMAHRSIDLSTYWFTTKRIRWWLFINVGHVYSQIQLVPVHLPSIFEHNTWDFYVSVAHSQFQRFYTTRLYNHMNFQSIGWDILLPVSTVRRPSIIVQCENWITRTTLDKCSPLNPA